MKVQLLALSFLISSVSVYAQTNTQTTIEKNETADALLQAALKARYEGNIKLSLELLLKAEKLEPKNLDIQFYLGLTYYGLGDIPTAGRILKAILDIEPRYVDAKIILGRVLTATGDFRNSQILLEQAIEQTPEYMDAYDALASNYLAQKLFYDAIHALDRGLAVKEDNNLLARKGNILYIVKNFDEASRIADILADSNDVEARYKGLILQAKIGVERDPTNYKDALKLIEKALSYNTLEDEAYLIQADVFISVWKFDEAKAILNKGLAKAKDKSRIQQKLTTLPAIEDDVKLFSVATTTSQWLFDDPDRVAWKEFYLDGVWRIDPFKTLVVGLEKFDRGALSDQTIRIEYVQRLGKWVYAYGALRMTDDPDFREHSGGKGGLNVVVNPLKTGPTILSVEGESRKYDSGNVYFGAIAAEQYIGTAFIVNAKVFKVITAEDNFTVWSSKLTWTPTEKLTLSAGYGTMNEVINKKMVKGYSASLGAQYRLNDQVSLTANYTRHDNDAYKANQYSVGIKVDFGKPSKSSSKKR